MGAIRSATAVAAEQFGWQDRLGTIEAGRLAVAGDPLIDIGEPEKVQFVMKTGVVYRSTR